MYLNTRIFPTTGHARVLLFMFTMRELGGTGTGCLFQFTYCDIRSFKSLAKVLFEICTYMQLKLYKQKHQFSTMKPTITQVLLFHKGMCTLSPGQDIEPLSFRILIGVVCVYREGGCFDIVGFCNAIFSKSELKHKLFSCKTN